MAERRPLVLLGGRLAELPTTDSLPGGGSGVVVSDTEPSSPTEGMEWFDTTSGIQYTRVGSSWVSQGDASLTGYTFATKFMTSAELADVQSGTVSINVLPKIQAAFAAGKRIFVPDGRYFLGSPTTSAALIDLSSLGDGITIHAGKNVEWVVNTTGTGAIPRIFNLSGNNRFHADHMYFRETNFDAATQRGAIAFHFENGSGTWNGGDISIAGISTKNCMAALHSSGPATPTANRIRGVWVGLIDADDGYYGVNCANDLDGLTVDRLNSRANYRPYFVYSVQDHTINIFHREGKASTGAVNIANYGDGAMPTRGIKVKYTSLDNSVGFNHVLVNHVGGTTSGGLIAGIDLDHTISGSVAYTPLSFINYTGPGGSPTAAASNNNVYDVTLKGSCDANAGPIVVTASYGGAGRLNFTPGWGFALSSDLRDKFSSSASYTPTWTAASTNPSIGNGTLTGSYTSAGGMCTTVIELVIGSTTTMGSGVWSFSAPFTAKAIGIGSAYALDSGTAFFTGVCEVASGATTILALVGNNVGNYTNPATPFTWAAGDRLRMSITYAV